MQNSILIKRLKAFAIDYCIILGYMLLLICGTLLISRIFHLRLGSINPVIGELISFTTLTLPVILYFTLCENSKHAGTIGKRKFGLQIVNNSSTKANCMQLLIRNVTKFLPWEIAHFFIYRLFYFNAIGNNVPNWVLTGLIVSQGLALVYLLCIILTNNNQSIYELLSRTKVVANEV